MLEWVVELKNKLIEFITTLYNPDGVPVLYDMYQHYIKKLSGNPNEQSMLHYSDNNQYLSSLENTNKQLLMVVEELTNKYNSLQQNYKQVLQNNSSSQNQLNSISLSPRTSGVLCRKN